MTPRQLLDHLIQTYDLPRMYVIQACRMAEKDHHDDLRVYAHVFHGPDMTICLCKAYSKLTLGHKIGIMVHEIGHLMSDGGEAEADLWVHEHLGINIDFKATVQWVEPEVVGL